MSPLLSPSKRTEIRALTTLALPLVVAQLAQMAMGVVGTMVAGQISVRALAAQGLGATAFSLILILAFGVMSGLDPHISRAVGAGDDARAARLFQQGLWQSVLLGLPLALAIPFAGRGLRWMGQDPGVMADVQEYLNWTAIGLVPAMAFAAARSFLSALGETTLIMRAAVLANVAHVGLCLWLGLGGLGVPKLGMAGIGIAAVLCRLLFLAVLWWGMRRHPRLRQMSLGWVRPDTQLLRVVLRSGLPLGLQYGLEASGFALVTFWMGLLSAEALAAHEVALNIAALSFQVPFAIATAAAMRVGHAVGRQDEPGIAIAGWTALQVGVVYAGLAGLAMLALRAPMAALYMPHGDAETLLLTSSFLMIAAAFQLADGAQAIGFGVLRGLDDTRVPVLFNVLGFSMLGLPLGFTMVFVRHQPATWLWWGLSLALAVVAVGLALRFRWLLRRRSL